MLRCALECRNDLVAPLGETRYHLAFGFERRLVSFRRCNVEFSAAKKSVATRPAAGLESQRRDMDDVRAMQRDEPVRRPHKSHGRRIRPLVGHDFGNRKAGEGFIERFLQPALERLAFCHSTQIDVFGFSVARDIHAIGSVLHLARRGCQVRAADCREFSLVGFGWLRRGVPGRP